MATTPRRQGCNKCFHITMSTVWNSTFWHSTHRNVPMYVQRTLCDSSENWNSFLGPLQTLQNRWMDSFGLRARLFFASNACSTQQCEEFKLFLATNVKEFRIFTVEENDDLGCLLNFLFFAVSVFSVYNKRRGKRFHWKKKVNVGGSTDIEVSNTSFSIAKKWYTKRIEWWNQFFSSTEISDSFPYSLWLQEVAK
jgi:hypothetical protein